MMSKMPLTVWLCLLNFLERPTVDASVFESLRGLAETQTTKSKVLLISMDGFGASYVGKVAMPNFDIVKAKGTKAQYVVPPFTTKTFPCHYTIATGLHTESHGIINNDMIEPKTGAKFNKGSTESFWYDGGEPLWVTARKQNLTSATYYWIGSYSEIRGVRPNFYQPTYIESVPFEERVDKVVGWLADDNVDLAMLYFHSPDQAGHLYGPESQEVLKEVQRMDTLLGYIMKKLSDRKLSDKVNMIVTSDHGMTSISQTKVIDLLDYLNRADIVVVKDRLGEVANIQVAPAKLEEVYNKLKVVKNMNVYKRKEVPAKWHYSNNDRILDLVAVADEHWTIVLNATAYTSRKGSHGYDNFLPSMRSIFYAMGPNIKVNHTADPFDLVDVYPMVCHLLGVTPSPNNGTLDHTKAFLTTTKGKGNNAATVFSFGTSVIVPLLVMLTN